MAVSAYGADLSSALHWQWQSCLVFQIWPWDRQHTTDGPTLATNQCIAGHQGWSIIKWKIKRHLMLCLNMCINFLTFRHASVRYSTLYRLETVGIGCFVHLEYMWVPPPTRDVIHANMGPSAVLGPGGPLTGKSSPVRNTNSVSAATSRCHQTQLTQTTDHGGSNTTTTSYLATSSYCLWWRVFLCPFICLSLAI